MPSSCSFEVVSQSVTPKASLNNMQSPMVGSSRSALGDTGAVPRAGLPDTISQPNRPGSDSDPGAGEEPLEILPGIHTIPSVKFSKAYLIEGETLTLVDAGLPWHGRTVLRYIASIGRKPEELSHILVTHRHPDHTGGIKHITKKTGAAVIAHSADTRERRGGNPTLGYMGIFGALPVPMPFLGRMPVVTPVQDGELLSIGGGVRVIHTPGHTSGSVCFLDESTKTLFSGDTIFSDGTRISRSVPFPGYDDQAYRDSLRRLASMDFAAVCGGHGRPLLDGGAGILAELLDARPDPPTWGRFFMSMPRRLRRSLPMTGEDP